MKKIISLLLAMVLVVSLIPGVFAAEGDSYLALGDSITKGTGLKSGESSFAEILAANNGWSMTNMGEEGQTSEGLLAQIQGGSCDEAIKAAKYITITVGANDMMDLMFGLVVDAYNAVNESKITVEDVNTIMQSGMSDSRFFALAAVTLTVITGDAVNNVPAFPEREEFKACVDSLASNLESAVKYIRKLNSKATVIVPTQYNPFAAFSSDMILKSIVPYVEAASVKLNGAITAAGEKAGYDIADVYTAFNSSDENLCNASTSPVNLDYNPNAKGHQVIAELMQEIVDSKIVNYLALGDSITAGTALNEGEPSFPEILAGNNGWNLTNMGSNGMTAAGLLAQISDHSIDNDIATAKVITITVGGNDVMNAMYELLAQGYNESHEDQIKPSDVILIMTNPQDSRFLELLAVGITLLNGDEAAGIPAFADRPEFQAKIDEGVANMKAIMEYIRSVNAEVPVVITTQYNPYKSFDASVYSIVSKSINEGAKKLNSAIKTAGKECGYLVADVFSAFHYSDEVLCNATATPLNLDFHPNARGHKVIAQLIQDVLDGKPEPNYSPFTDVKPGDFFYESVLWAVESGVTTGATPTTFNPGGNCQRGQVVTFLWRAAGSPEPTSNVNPFEDVKESDFYYKAVLWAVENEITNGVDATHFGPFAFCNRAQVVTFLYRAEGKPEVTTTECPFTDVVAGQWYEAPVLWAVENGVTNGMDAVTFGVNTDCNRAQVVTFLYRAQ